MLSLMCLYYCQVVFPPQLEDIREKMAENIHELWAMDRIDLGWTYGPVRKNKKSESFYNLRSQCFDRFGSLIIFFL